ncbi:MAG: PAS domain-containing protein [Acidobacteriia bacterium]|nr:PAS domain-containing protein [Terriglobia bacterium]
MRLRLKAKLVIAISAMVVALVATLSYIYMSQMLRQRVREEYQTGDFIAHQIYHGAREALELDLVNANVDADDPQAVAAAIEDSLQTDPGLNSLLQSIVGYSPTIYDAAITDTSGRALLHTDADAQGKPVPPRPDFAEVVKGGFRQQMDIVFGKPRVYEVRLPLSRAGKPFGQIRIGLSTVFLKSELQPQITHALEFTAISILVSLLLAAALSHFALRPLAAIGERLDRMAAGDIEAAPAKRPARYDEYGLVTTKIDRLGQQMRDVKEVFSALKENLDQLMGNLQDGLMLFAQNARVVLVSASAEQFVGRARGEMLGRQVSDVFARDTRLGHMVLDAFDLRQPISQREIEVEGGRTVQVSLDFIEQDGQNIGALLTMRDAESVRKIEDEIELSRRMAAIGRLTSGVAHEVRNPINAILLHLEVLREKIQQIDPESRRHMDVIGNEIQRLDRVVQTLVDFTKPVELRLGDTDLRRVIDDVSVLAAPEAAKLGVALHSELPPAPLVVKADADLVKQAVLNIALNGIQAMPGGGTLVIAARHEVNAVEIEIRDQGPGISPEVRDKIFNLYFTTKKSGSGIGLAMAYRVMQLHNGSLQFESQPGQGTVFYLRFPAPEPIRSAASREAAQAQKISAAS